MTGSRIDPDTALAARRTPAPGELALVQAFLNTNDIEAGADRFATTSGARAWLADNGLPAGDAPRHPTELARLAAFREALRDLLATRDTADAPSEATDAVLGRATRDAHLLVGLDDLGRPRLEPAGSGVDALIGRILAAIVSSTADGTWPRLKICWNDACRWSFYDASRNHSGHWCSMSVCGNRMKGRTFRRRRAAVTERPPTP